MTDAELEALAVKCGIYWVSEKTAYLHADTMRAFADALTEIERERCVAIVQANADACEPGSMLAVCLASNAAAIRAGPEPSIDGWPLWSGLPPAAKP